LKRRGKNLQLSNHKKNLKHFEQNSTKTKAAFKIFLSIKWFNGIGTFSASIGFLLVMKHRLSTCYETGAGGALINFKIGNYYELYYK
jgi:hypothetical protein